MASERAKPKLSRGAAFGTAGLGGIAGWIVVHPFNTLAVRMNLSTMNAGGAPPSFPAFAAGIVRQEGVLTLYQGIGAGITRQIFYATSRFGLFEVFRDFVAQYRPTDVWSRLATGTAAGACAAFISCPAEVTLVRMSNDRSLPRAQRRGYRNIADAAVRIAREEGPATLWRGSMPFVNRAMLVGATQVATYDQFKQLYASMGLTGPFINIFSASMTSGLLYSLITMPFETAKNRMAFQKPLPDGALRYRATLQTISTVAGAEGTLALWQGFAPYYARCGGHTVAMFICVEYLRKEYLRPHALPQKWEPHSDHLFGWH